jgi:hypothetical protein
MTPVAPRTACLRGAGPQSCHAGVALRWRKPNELLAGTLRAPAYAVTSLWNSWFDLQNSNTG